MAMPVNTTLLELYSLDSIELTSNKLRYQQLKNHIQFQLVCIKFIKFISRQQTRQTQLYINYKECNSIFLNGH